MFEFSGPGVNNGALVSLAQSQDLSLLFIRIYVIIYVRNTLLGQ